MMMWWGKSFEKPWQTSHDDDVYDVVDDDDGDGDGDGDADDAADDDDDDDDDDRIY